MEERESGWHHNPQHLVRFEDTNGTMRKILLEPGMYPIVRHVLANFTQDDIKFRESFEQRETGTSRRFDISSTYSFDLDFLNHEILSAVDSFIENMLKGSDRYEANFNMIQDFTPQKVKRRYKEFCQINEEKIREEVFKVQSDSSSVQ